MAGACVPAAGQDILKAEDRVTYIDSSLYADDQSGNQDTVREYDGREFDLWGIDSLNSYGYGGDFQYWLDARNLLLGDEDVTLDLGVRNELTLNIKSSSLLHRLVRIPGVDPYLAQFGLSSITPGPPVVLVGSAFLDLTPDGRLAVKRHLNDFSVKLTPGGSTRTAYRAAWWQESEGGREQFNYRGGSPSRLESVDFGIDRTIERGTLGLDVRLGSYAAANYSFERNQFSDSGMPLINEDRPALVVTPNIKTSSNLFRARSRLSDRLYFAGVHINRRRTNETATMVENRNVELNSTNAALTYLASDALTLSGRFRTYQLDNHISPILGDPGDPADNIALNRKERSFQLEGNFTGLKKALVRVGYEHRKAERELPDGFPANPDLAATMEAKTTSNIWRTSLSYHPTWRLSFTGKLDRWNVDNPQFKGSPGDRNRMHLNSTYLINDNVALYADYSKFHDARRDASGLDNKSTDAVLGAWYGITDKITVDALYARAKIDATTLWEQAPHALDPVSTKDVPYRARNNQFSVGVNYAVTPKTAAYLRFLDSDSRGTTDVTGLVPGDPDLTDGWAPIQVEESRWTLGFTRDLTAKDRLFLEYSLADWTDRIDPANDGKFSLWRIAWSTGF